MRNRAISGSTEWARYDVVLDVPRDAQDVSFGASQRGLGTTWLDEYTLEIVNETVSTTVLPPGDRAAFCATHAIQLSGKDPLIEDVEDGDREIRTADGRSGRWWLTHDDGCQVMPKDPAPAAPGGNDSSHYAIRGGARDCNAWGFGLGFALNSSGDGLCAYDASRYDGVYFWARSGQANVTIHFRVGTRQTWPAKEGGDGTCDAQPNGCWDDYALDFTLDPIWKLYSATWSQLAQKGWGKETAFQVRETNSLTWSTEAEPAEYREIWIDQVGFFEGAPPATPP